MKGKMFLREERRRRRRRWKKKLVVVVDLTYLQGLGLGAGWFVVDFLLLETVECCLAGIGMPSVA
jgi:hypothetical protein